jgi:hypothetical protein
LVSADKGQPGGFFASERSMGLKGSGQGWLDGFYSGKMPDDRLLGQGQGGQRGCPRLGSGSFDQQADVLRCRNHPVLDLLPP